jgi:hypothetical protein
MADRNKKSFKEMLEGEDVPIETNPNPAYSDEQIEEMRARGAAIDPAYAKTREARLRGSGGMETSIEDPFARRGSRTGAMSEGVGHVASLGGNVAFEDETRAEGATHGVDTSVDMGSSGDEIAPTSRYTGISMGGFDAEAPGLRESPFTRIREGGDQARKVRAMTGMLLLREAGRCDSPGCQLLRATGLQLTGQTQRGAGSGIESQLPAVPSVAEQKKFYPENPVTGKQDRKNVQTFTEVSPANPKSPEWVALTGEAKGAPSSSLFFPEDALAHHHPDEGAHLAYVQQRIAGLLSGQGDYN